jgi:hypothetical protein
MLRGADKFPPDAGADTSGGSCALEHDLPAEEECLTRRTIGRLEQ